MKKVLAFLMICAIPASLAVTSFAVVNSNHYVDEGWPKFNSDETEWDVYCWTVVDTKITALGYMLDGDEPVWIIDKIIVRDDADKVLANDCFEDLELERAIIEYGLQNGLDNFFAYRIHITLDTSEMKKGLHTLEVVVRYEDGSEGNPLRESIIEIGKKKNPASQETTAEATTAEETTAEVTTAEEVTTEAVTTAEETTQAVTTEAGTEKETEEITAAEPAGTDKEPAATDKVTEKTAENTSSSGVNPGVIVAVAAGCAAVAAAVAFIIIKKKKK